ncbi:MAG: DUF1552 domain-containing protein [Polyangiaceae bacterium]|nr:DUF1552 domain-containing protein [Polyangiaceae bacterium]
MKTRSTLSRRNLLKTLGGAALALPFYKLLSPSEARAETTAKRVIFFYFPDGVALPFGGTSLEDDFHAQGQGSNFTLSKQLEPLAPFKNDCVFLRGLTMGGTDSNSHPGGAKKLLTGVDGGNGQSLDQYLAQTVGASAPWHHLYLGAMSKKSKDAPLASDEYISYPSAGQSIVPEDNPLTAFSSLFGQGTSQPGQTGPNPNDVSIIDGVLDDMKSLQTRLGNVEKSKLDIHLEALREAEKRIKTTGTTMEAGCDSPLTPAVDSEALYKDEQFPAILKAQIDTMVLGMMCGLTKVGTLQASYHTSELIMSRFQGTEMYVPNFDMRSHQASHYGTTSNDLYGHFKKQCRWWMSQFAYLLGELQKRPDGDGTMLDTSLIVLCTEVSDGNNHSHDNMPFILAGRANGRLSTGRALAYDGVRHSNLLSSIAHAMGEQVCFGQECGGPLNGLLS